MHGSDVVDECWGACERPELADLRRAVIVAALLIDHCWMRFGYLVIRDPPIRVDAPPDGLARQWSDGWGVMAAGTPRA